MTVVVTTATEAELSELADVAAQTFPLACPPTVTADNIEKFVAANLSAQRFAGYLDDPDRAVFVAKRDGRILGYAMLIRGVPDDPDVQLAVTVRPAVELSKIYVLPQVHGGAVAAAFGYARDQRAECVWLGVNKEDQRAQRFYTKHGFTVSGTKSFHLGAGVE